MYASYSLWTGGPAKNRGNNNYGICEYTIIIFLHLHMHFLYQKKPSGPLRV